MSLFRFASILLPSLLSLTSLRAASDFVFIGTVNEKGTSHGIYRASFDPATGKLGNAELAAEIGSPSFLANHPTLPVLYALGETRSSDGRTTGFVQAFAVSASGGLESLGTQPTEGAELCHLSVDATGKLLLGANYNEGVVVVFPLQAGGRIGPRSAFFQQQGSSVNAGRQAGPHAHCIVPDPANRFALVADLGADAVFTYRLNPAAGTISQEPAVFRSRAGAGPRHLAFDADNRHVYIINELDCTVTVADFDSERGLMKEKQTVSLLIHQPRGNSTAAEIVLHPNGHFLYASVRGHDALVLFAVDGNSGCLKFVDSFHQGIEHARHFSIDATGRWLLCANRNADDVAVFAIDPISGRLSGTGIETPVPMPTFVQIHPRR